MQKPAILLAALFVLTSTNIANNALTAFRKYAVSDYYSPIIIVIIVGIAAWAWEKVNKP
jgi:Na+-translocating ferredoxin:NAD+ oxidoreductase RnfE subunit